MALNSVSALDIEDYVSQQILRIAVSPRDPRVEFFTFARHTLRLGLDDAAVVARLRPALDLAEAKLRMETR